MGGKQKRVSTFTFEEHDWMTSFSKRHYYLCKISRSNVIFSRYIVMIKVLLIKKDVNQLFWNALVVEKAQQERD